MTPWPILSNKILLIKLGKDRMFWFNCVMACALTKEMHRRYMQLWMEGVSVHMKGVAAHRLSTHGCNAYLNISLDIALNRQNVRTVRTGKYAFVRRISALIAWQNSFDECTEMLYRYIARVLREDSLSANWIKRALLHVSLNVSIGSIWCALPYEMYIRLTYENGWKFWSRMESKERFYLLCSALLL